MKNLEKNANDMKAAISKTAAARRVASRNDEAERSRTVGG